MKIKHLTLSLFCLCSLYQFTFMGQVTTHRLNNIWRYQEGDYPKDSLIKAVQSQSLTLGYNETVVLTFNNPSANKSPYEFRITPTELYSKWRLIGEAPVLNLPTLNGGNYSLELRTEDKVVAQLAITVKQAFWQKWWFVPSIILYVLLLIGIFVYLFLLYNFRQKLKIQYVRNSIAADLHDEVGSNLTSIAIFVELLRRKSPPELFPILDKISANSTESVQLMRDTIWAIQAKNDDFELFTQKLKSLASELLAAKDIALMFESKIEHIKNVVAMEQRKNAYLIYKEAINNIVKHSNASKVLIKLFVENQRIWLIINDNGCGFNTNQIKEGNGLRNFIERAEVNEMQFSIVSVKDEGTTITLGIPLP